jgi:hypothetical protein
VLGAVPNFEQRLGLWHARGAGGLHSLSRRSASVPPTVATLPSGSCRVMPANAHRVCVLLFFSAIRTGLTPAKVAFMSISAA